MARDAEQKRFLGGPRPVGALVPALTRPAFKRKSPAGAMIMADWPALVGPAIAAVTQPLRLTQGTLTLACAGPVAMGSGLYMLGYAVLVFGLLARIAQPQDQIARIVIAVGAAMLVPDFIDILRFAFRFSFHGGAIFTVLYLLTFVVTLVGIACALFVVPPQKLPPALQAVDALGPLFTAVLILFLPAKVLLMGLGLLIHGHGGISAILLMAHLLIRIVAFFGVLMLVAPAAYEEVMRLVKGGGGGGGGAQGGGYPPQGGGYPPPGGGYPPPQGGGYPPPQGGGYPPQQGGGWQ